MPHYCLVYHLVVTTSSTLQTHFIFSAVNSLVQKLSLPPAVASISWNSTLGAFTLLVVITFLPSAVSSWTQITVEYYLPRKINENLKLFPHLELGLRSLDQALLLEGPLVPLLRDGHKRLGLVPQLSVTKTQLY